MAFKFNSVIHRAFLDEFEKVAESDHGNGELGELNVSKSAPAQPGGIKNNETKNPKAPMNWKDTGKQVGWAVGGYVVGTGLGQGISRLIPKNNPTAKKVTALALPLVGVVGAEMSRKYRDKLDRNVWHDKK